MPRGNNCEKRQLPLLPLPLMGLNLRMVRAPLKLRAI